MLVIGKPQNLGKKTLMLILARRTSVGFVVFMAAIILATVSPAVSLMIVNLMSLSGSSGHSAIANISGAVSSFSVMALLAGIILIMVGIIIGLIQYRNHIFILDEFSLKFRRGIFDQMEVSIPYRQIQDMNIVRTIPHRIFGVSRLIMITAGREDTADHNEADTIFDPIDADLAVDIRVFLERKIGVQVIERMVQADKEEKVEEKTTSEGKPVDEVVQPSGVADIAKENPPEQTNA